MRGKNVRSFTRGLEEHKDRVLITTKLAVEETLAKIIRSGYLIGNETHPGGNGLTRLSRLLTLGS